MSAENVYKHFYRTLRLSATELSDGGGPFGFDITTALEFDYLIERYQCDAVIETGSNMGDTTEYLARAYPHLTSVTCDVVDRDVDGSQVQQFLLWLERERSLRDDALRGERRQDLPKRIWSVG